jgi:TolA-binding protein
VYVAYAKNNPKSAKAPDALRNAIETYMTADSVARRRGDEAASRQAREHAIDLSAQLVEEYPDYKYRFQYQALRARLLADLGKQDEAIKAYQELVAQNPDWSGRPDAMVRLAIMLDSAGRKPEAAAAYAQFANSYPNDRRAADALWNAAATYAEANDPRSAARTFAAFAQRYPSDSRAREARQQQIALLQTAGDTSAASAALSDACAKNADAMRAECASRVADRSFRAGVAVFSQYEPIKLRIASKSQLTANGVARASREKQALLKELGTDFAAAIKSGVPSYLAAGSYYVGLAQWNYGQFLKDVELPDNLTDDERAAAQRGAEQQSQQYFNAAKQVWQELVQRAQSTPAIGNDPAAKAWVQRAQDALQGNVDTSPPSTVTGGGGR